MDCAEELPTKSRTGAEEIDVLFCLRIVSKYKWFLLGASFLSAGIFAMWSLSLPNTFRSTAIVVPASSGDAQASSLLARNLGGLAGLAGVAGGGGDSDTEKNLAILTSRDFLQDMVSNIQVKKVIFPELLDKSGEFASGRVPSDLASYGRFVSKILSVSDDRATGLVSLSITTIDASLSSEWALSLVNKLNSFVRQKKMLSAKNNLAYLREQVESTEAVEMKEVLYQLMEAEAKSAMLANVRKDYAFEIIEHPYPAELKFAPIRSKKVVVGGMLGLMLAFILIYIRYVYRLYQTRLE